MEKTYAQRFGEYRHILLREPDLFMPAESTGRQRTPDEFDLTFLYVLAPAAVSFAEWVLERAVREGKKRLYFAARDMWLVKAAAERIAAREGTDIEIRYLRISRYAVRCAEYHTAGEGCLDTICVGGIDATFRKIMRRAMLTREEAGEIAGALGYGERMDESLNYRQVRMLREALRGVPEFFTYVGRHAAECHADTLGYLRQEGMLDDVPYALVDSGWVGTLQMSLQNVLRSVPEGRGRKLCGYYFGLYGRPEGAERWQYAAYYFDTRDIRRKVYFSNCLFEAVFSEPSGMTLGYEKRNGRYGAVTDERGNQNGQILKEEMKLLSGYVDAYLERKSAGNGPAGGAGKTGAGRTDTLFRLFSLFMGRPEKTEARVFGSFRFCDDVLEQQIQPVAAPLGAEEIKRQRFLHKALCRMNLIKGELHDSAWAEGSYANAGGAVEKNIRQERMYKRFIYTRKAVQAWTGNR